jgi:hypothetical protein
MVSTAAMEPATSQSTIHSGGFACAHPNHALAEKPNMAAVKAASRLVGCAVGLCSTVSDTRRL